MNKYLEKIAALNPTAKKFAMRVLGNIKGDTGKINNVYNAASGVVSKSKAGVFSEAEKTGIKNTFKASADAQIGPGKLYHMEATRAARAGSRLARIQLKKAA
jgi:hypothetical protein